MIDKSNFFSNHSKDMGVSAEALFAKVAIERGWIVERASSKQDYFDHWDYRIINDNHRFKIDVKARKRICRNDHCVNDKWTWLELHGVCKNYHGWLYGGKANLIAFEAPQAFILIDRKLLIALAELLVTDKKVDRAVDAKYCRYSRRNMYDVVTLIETKHIRDNAWGVWEINPAFLLDKIVRV